MGLLKEAVGEVGKKLESTPGLGYVSVVASASLAFLLRSSNSEEAWSLLLLAYAVSLVAYWCGSFLDLLLEPFVGLPPDNPPITKLKWWGRRLLVDPVRSLLQRSRLVARMAGHRRDAARKFHASNQRGIYTTAKRLLAGTESWDGRIRLYLDLSKLARTLVIPALGLLVWEVLASYTDLPGPDLSRGDPRLAWVEHPVLPLLVSLLVISAYVHLRLRHMLHLYRQLETTPSFRFTVVPIAPHPETLEMLWCVGGRVMAERELPVCQPSS